MAPSVSRLTAHFHPAFTRTKSMLRFPKLLRSVVLCGLAFTTLAFASTNKNKTQVTYPSAFGVSQRLSDLPIDLSLFPNRVMREPRPSALAFHATPGPWQHDPVLQTEALPEVSATQGISFDGITQSGWIPPDNNLAIGPTKIFITVNTDVAVYSKTGTLLSGPTNIPTVFAPLGGLCTTDVVDPIVLYDRAADRWVIAGIGDNYAGSYGECVAVSTSNDPAGTYSLYFYSFGTTLN